MVELTPEQAVQRAKMEEQQLQALQQQGTQILQLIQEARATKQMLEDLKGFESTSMFPIGSGVFVEGKLSGGKFMMDVGAGNIIEASIEDITKVLEKREKDLNNTLKKIGVDAQEVGEDLEALRMKINDYVRKKQSENDIPVIG